MTTDRTDDILEGNKAIAGFVRARCTGLVASSEQSDRRWVHSLRKREGLPVVELAGRRYSRRRWVDGWWRRKLISQLGDQLATELLALDQAVA